MKYLVFSCGWNFNKSMLKSPMIYDSLLSLFILVVISASLVVQIFIYARGCEFGRYIPPNIIDLVWLSLTSINNVSIT